MFYNTEDLKNEQIYLKLIKTCGAIPHKQWLPAYFFDICLFNGTVVGHCTLRIGYNEKTYIGGNIGYDIIEEYRGHRYAAQACLLLFKLAKKHHLDYLYISCVPQNIASSRTCEIAGGQFIEIADIPKDDEMYREGKRQVKIYKFDI